MLQIHAKRLWLPFKFTSKVFCHVGHTSWIFSCSWKILKSKHFLVGSFAKKLWVLEQKWIEMKLLQMQFATFLFSIPFLAGCTVSKKNGSESQKSSISCKLFCNETMIFRAKMHRDEVVENDISFTFVLNTSSPRLHRFRDFWRFLFFLEFHYYRRFLEKNTAFLPKLATFLPKKSINSLDFELRSSKIPYFRLFSCWEPKNGKFPRFWP